VLVEPEFPEIEKATLRIKNPYHAFSRTLGFFYQPPFTRWEFIRLRSSTRLQSSARARTSGLRSDWPEVKLGAHAMLLPHVVLYPGVEAGSHFFAHAHAVVRENCILGDHVTLENGVIIGADGFGFSKNEQGHWEKIRNPAR